MVFSTFSLQFSISLIDIPIFINSFGMKLLSKIHKVSLSNVILSFPIE
ncbi:hypothetical protein bcere0013_57910 [Bacillus cereus BDRD-ST26]|nr:hypothetical protein bcere0013_57910 [Bacillus cereus BDRD-ST26]